MGGCSAQNALEHPADEHYRRIRQRNRAFHDRAGRHAEALELLRLAGFIPLARPMTLYSVSLLAFNRTGLSSLLLMYICALRFHAAYYLICTSVRGQAVL